jgi:Mannosylglycerate hydrolase MGH1-like glycoside hydrolase domain
MPTTHTMELTGAEAAELEAAARAVLDDNWLGASTVPSRTLYPHQWSWDSAFIAIGRSWYDQQRAQTELETLFNGQWVNGMLPHIVFNPAVAPEGYFPGPDFWQSHRASGHPEGMATSGITQPPLHAAAALEVYRHAADPPEALAFLERLYPKLVAQHAYLKTWRDPDRRGLAAIVHPWESGLDNSPAWDHLLTELEIPPGAVPPYRRFDVLHADPADRPTDAAYDRFVYLVVTYRDAGYDDTTLLAGSPFLIQGPLFNAIWRWSADALAEIARLVGDDPAPHHADARRIRQAILDQLWDRNGQRFGIRDVRRDQRTPEDTIIAFSPLLDPALPRPMVGAITGLLGSPCFHPAEPVEHYLVPTYDLRAPGFDPRRYWRGPVWINTDWLLWLGLRQHRVEDLAAELRASMLGLVRKSGFREYFHPFGGQGFGASGFAWTAALVIDVLHRERTGSKQPTATAR